MAKGRAKVGSLPPAESTHSLCACLGWEGRQNTGLENPNVPAFLKQDELARRGQGRPGSPREQRGCGQLWVPEQSPGHRCYEHQHRAL